MICPDRAQTPMRNSFDSLRLVPHVCVRHQTVPAGLFGSPNLQCWGTRAWLPRFWNLSSGKVANFPAYSKPTWLCGHTSSHVTDTYRSPDQVTGFRFRHAMYPTFHPDPCTCNLPAPPKNLVFKRSYFCMCERKNPDESCVGIDTNYRSGNHHGESQFHARRNLRGSNSPRNWGRTGGDVLCDTAVLHSGHIQRLNTHQ